jgi:hypothetical protein
MPFIDNTHYTTYGLIDPREPGVVRYVGHTGQPLSKRLGQHYTRATTSGNHGRTSRWIRELVRQGIKPSIVILEEHECEMNALLAEIRLIAAYRARGSRLTNGSDGGESRHRLSAEERRALAAARLRGDGHLAAWSNARRGAPPQATPTAGQANNTRQEALRILRILRNALERIFTKNDATNGCSL